mgnify:CR=1 FL=1|jgi:hypothetical protein
MRFSPGVFQLFFGFPSLRPLTAGLTLLFLRKLFYYLDRPYRREYDFVCVRILESHGIRIFIPEKHDYQEGCNFRDAGCPEC